MWAQEDLLFRKKPKKCKVKKLLSNSYPALKDDTEVFAFL